MIENVQIRATKLVDGLCELDYTDRLKKIDVPTLVFRREWGDVIEVYKHLHIYDENIIPPKFKRRTRPSRRHDFQLVENIPRDGVRGAQLNSFYFRTTRMWNNLPKQVVNATTLDTFKKMLDEAWQHRPTKYDHTRWNES